MSYCLCCVDLHACVLYSHFHIFNLVKLCLEKQKIIFLPDKGEGGVKFVQ